MQYYFKEPLMLTSTHKTPIYNNEENYVGSVTKSYKNKVHRYVSLFMNKLYFNYTFYDEEGNTISTINNIMDNKKDFMKSRWIYTNSQQSYIVHNVTKVLTNFHLKIKSESSIIYEVKRDFGEHIIHIYMDNREIGYVKYGIKLPREIDIYIEDEHLNLDLVCFIYFIYKMYGS